MNLSEAAIIAIITMLATYILGPVVTRFLSRKNDAAGREFTFAQAAELTVKNVLTALEEQQKTNKELSERMETLEEALNLKNAYIDALEREVKETRELKIYVRALIEFLRGKGVDYPPPPEGLLDTDPKIKVKIK